MTNFLKSLCTLLLLLFATIASAQETNVTGVIRESSRNEPLEGVTIKISGTNRITKTDANGGFTITAKPGDVLEFSFVGYATQRVTYKGSAINLTLQSTSAQELDEVVVAMDIKRNPKELGFSTAKVEGAEIQQTQRENFLNSLQGRVAGLTVTSTSGVPGASSSIILRGFNSLSLNNQPLFVVDGIIVDNSTMDIVNNVAAAAGQNSTSNDFTNRIADINPNDIESLTVLKGPEATVLYGSLASSGAIVITTKKARLTKGKKINVNYDNSIRVQSLRNFPAAYNGFSQGRNGVADTTTFATFGPAYPADTKFYDNTANFFRTAWGQTHNLSTEFGVPVATFRLSGSYFTQDGVVPNSNQTRTNFKITNTTKIGKYIDVTPSFAYTHSHTRKPLKGAGGYLLNLYLWPTTNDARTYERTDGKKIFLTNSAAADNFSESDNPFFAANRNVSQDDQNRYISTLAININPYKWLTIAGRFGLDQYKTDGFQFRDPQSVSQSSLSNLGSLDNYYTKYLGYNHTITATVKKTVGNFGGRFTLGTRWNQTETQRFAVSGIKDSSRSYDSSNTQVSTRTRLSAAKYGNWNKYQLRQVAGFGEMTLNYKSLVFLTTSIAFESSSVLPKANRNYHYPGGSLSVIMSDIVPGLKGKLLNYWKLRSSLASTARLPDPYLNQSNFVDVITNSSVPFTYQYAFLNANPDLKPEKQNTYEVGTEARFLNNLVSLDFTYYNTLCKDQIAQGFRASYGTGFVLNTQNNSSVRNQGIEVTLGISPVRKKEVSWDINFNFNHMWNKVLAIPLPIFLGGGDYYDASTWLYNNARGGLVQGGSTGSITGYGYARNIYGDVIIDATTGLPTIEGLFKVRGNRTPSFTLGTSNRIRYKNFNLSFLWDLRVGGDIFNGTNMYLTTNGRSAKTADRLTPRVVEGVLNNGLQNTANPTRNTILVTPYYNSTYYASTAMPEEDYIEKNINALRLRDVTLSYAIPTSILRRKLNGVQSLSFFATGNDMILFTNYGGADPDTNGGNASLKGVGAFGFDYGNIAPPLSFNFGLRAGF